MLQWAGRSHSSLKHVIRSPRNGSADAWPQSLCWMTNDFALSKRGLGTKWFSGCAPPMAVLWSIADYRLVELDAWFRCLLVCPLEIALKLITDLHWSPHRSLCLLPRSPVNQRSNTSARYRDSRAIAIAMLNRCRFLKNCIHREDTIGLRLQTIKHLYSCLWIPFDQFTSLVFIASIGARARIRCRRRDHQQLLPMFDWILRARFLLEIFDQILECGENVFHSLLTFAGSEVVP